MDIELSLIPSNRPCDPVTESALRAYFKRYPPARKAFCCAGAAEDLAGEITVFRDVFGWMEEGIDESALSGIACLLISKPDYGPERICRLVSIAGYPQLVLLRLALDRKRTPFLAQMEMNGYHVRRERRDVIYFFRSPNTLQAVSSGHQLGDPEIRRILEKSWWRIRKLPESTDVDLITVDGRELLVPKRFDIAIKCHYARLWLMGCGASWREYVYFAQALRVTGPDYEIVEHDNGSKSGINEFFEGFHSLLGDLDPFEIPHVPVDRELVAFDGSHRIAAAIATGRNVNCARVHAESRCRAPAVFFEEDSHGHGPCDSEILDEAAIEYCRIKDTVALALIFPTVASEQVAIRCLSEIGEIVYRKDVTLSPEGGGALLRQAYLGQSWLNETGDQSGFLHKQRSCFPFPGVLRAVILDRFDRKTLRSTKEDIRSAYGLGNHSIHITDSYEETLRVARIVFNRNSIELLNSGIGNSPGFHEKLFQYRDWLEAGNIDEERVCIDGGAVLSLLGLRECRDLDFLYHGDPEKLPSRPKKIDCHNEVERYHQHSISEVIGDPRMHCWYMGVKFCAPRLVCEMKMRRRESKDKADVILLRSRLPAHRSVLWDQFLFQVIRTWGYLRARSAPVVRKLKSILRPFVRFIRSRLN